MKIFALIVSIFWLSVTANAQDVVDVGRQRLPAPDLPEWSELLPDIPYCVKTRAASYDDGKGHGGRLIEFETQFPGRGLPLPDPPCGSFRIEFSYPFTPPPAPELTKKQLRERSREEKKIRKQDRKARKLTDISSHFYPKPPPSRPFLFKGYPAVQHFNAGCDYLLCPNPTRLDIQFAPGRVLLVSVNRSFEEVETILNRVDFDALNTEISDWIKTKLAEDKTKKPPVSERP